MNDFYFGLSDDEQTMYVKRDLEHVYVDVWDTTSQGREVAGKIAILLNSLNLPKEKEQE